MAALLLVAGGASAQSPNLGDPLFCQPQEGVQFLIVNGGAGIFTADGDCYNNNVNNDTTLNITTGMGGSLVGVRGAGNINYTYTPPTPNFTGLDTFSIPVTTVWNSAGGTGSAGGVARPGGPATLNITLNVLSATTTLTVPGAATTVPVPAGFITGCTAPGNAGQGPPPGAILGCVKGIFRGTAGPAHGTLTVPGLGMLRYTPNAGYTGPDTFQYQAVGVNTDGTFALNSGDVTVTVTVTAPLSITNASPLPTGVPGSAYSQTFTATGGAGGPYTFAVTSGALPPGLSLSSGVLSGMPTTAGVYNFTIQVTDSGSNTATKAFQLTITAVLTITNPPTFPGGGVGVPYSQTLTAAGGLGPYTFSVVSGLLPPGLSLSAAVISGTPSAPGNFTFTIQVTDSASNTATQAFNLTVQPQATSVPTLGTWGMVLLAGSLLLFGAKTLAGRPV